VAALCAEALGKDHVIGVTMPNGIQPDIDDSNKLINHLGIRHCCVNIGDTYNTLIEAVREQLGTLDAEVSRQTTINLPPRLRMSTLYAVSQWPTPVTSPRTGWAIRRVTVMPPVTSHRWVVSLCKKSKR
jgi:NAD+ synthase